MNFLPKSPQSQQLRICRCCLSEDSSNDLSIEFSNFRPAEVYEVMLNDVFNIQSPGMLQVKQSICKDCVIKLQQSSSFKQMVLRNQAMYMECLENLLKGKEAIETQLDSEFKQEEKEDSSNTNENYDLDTFGDNELFSNLKSESKCEAENIEFTTKTVRAKNSKSSTKVKLKENEHQELSKLAEHRGTGPILRENSLKIIINSTVTVFQWNRSSYACFCCKKPFIDFSILRNHTSTHKIEEIERRIITQHNQLVKVEVSTLNCKVCDKELPDLDALKLHLAEHSVIIQDHLLVPFRIESKLKCQLCSEPFASFRLLNMHVNKHYQRHVCYVCGAGFANLVFLNLHRSRLHRLIECEKCKVTFKSKPDKKAHDIEQHGVKFERKKRFPCTFCPQRFYQEDVKVRHMVESHGLERPECLCRFCPKTFVTRSLLNNHVKVVHMKERSHQCGVCSKVFYTKSDVARHSVTHTGVKGFACGVCSSLFANKDSLTRHMKRAHVNN